MDNLDKTKKFKFKSLPKIKFNKKNFVICGAVVLIGGAIFLNWVFFSGDGSGNSVYDYGLGKDIAGSADGTLGESSFVDGSSGNSEVENYFAVTQINRQRARDEAMEVLQLVVDDENALDELKTDALNGISQIAGNIEDEANIETLVIAKGFEECVAVISQQNANIVVKSSGLLPNEIVQIKEIVYEQAGISPSNVKIIEKNS